jgi:hypothetical protein
MARYVVMNILVLQIVTEFSFVSKSDYTICNLGGVNVKTSSATL